MLKKLLKYDFKAVFKYWWIAALATLGLALIGGGCITLLNADRILPTAVDIISILLLIMVIFGITAFSVLSTVLIFVRFYQNLFTDEGYLTFTLPVKRIQLLNSKLIMSTVAMLATFGVIVLDILIMLGIGFAKDIFTAEFLYGAKEVLRDIYHAIGFYSVIYLVELLVLGLLGIILSNLFLFMCISFAAMIAKRARVPIAIGIYYGGSGIFSFCVEYFYLFGLMSFGTWLEYLPRFQEATIAAILLGLCVFMAMFCVLIYTLVYGMMDRKLNLN